MADTDVVSTAVCVAVLLYKSGDWGIREEGLTVRPDLKVQPLSPSLFHKSLDNKT